MKGKFNFEALGGPSASLGIAAENVWIMRWLVVEAIAILGINACYICRARLMTKLGVSNKLETVANLGDNWRTSQHPFTWGYKGQVSIPLTQCSLLLTYGNQGIEWSIVHCWMAGWLVTPIPQTTFECVSHIRVSMYSLGYNYDKATSRTYSQ